MKTGEVESNGRWCEACNRFHGTLYLCPHYPLEVKAVVGEGINRWRLRLSDPAWCEAQIARGIPPEALIIQRIFAGLEP